MTFLRRVGVVGILGASWLVAVGCDDSDDKQDVGGEAGDGGEGPSAGKSSLGGSANNPGSGGIGAGEGGAAAAGSGGTANGGTASGGTASGGTASGGTGTSGDAGAGQAGGEAGAGAVPGAGGNSAAGASGDGGAGGAATAPALKKCDFACEDSTDCATGPDSFDECDPVLHRCRPTKLCDVAADCTPFSSFWFVTCADDSECTPDLERCVAWQGVGYCAALPDATTPEFPCIGGTPQDLPLFGTTGNAEVCADLTGVCDDRGQCGFGCGFLGCDAGTGDTCNAATGACECALSSECTAAGVSVCGASSLCGCANNVDCQATSSSTGLDTCFSGTCGCDSPASCLNPNARPTPVCE